MHYADLSILPAPLVWLEINNHVEPEPIVNAVAYKQDTLFYITADESIHLVATTNVVQPPYLIIDIPKAAIARITNTYFLRIIPLTPTSCIYSPLSNVYFLIRFDPRPPAIPAHLSLPDFPVGVCLVLDQTLPETLCMVDTFETVSNIFTIPIDDAHTLAPSESGQLWIPPPAFYPPLASSKATFNWQTAFSFDSPSVGRCIVLISATTILIHKRLPPFPTQNSLIAIIAMHNPTDILYRPDIDTLACLNYIGDVVHIECSQLAQDIYDVSTPVIIKSIIHLPAASMICSLSFIPGAIFAYNPTINSYIFFPQNSMKVNVVSAQL